jgi:hypothetical protein
VSTDDFSTRRTALYRLYDQDGQLLYLGIAHNLATRWRQHSKTQPWWPAVIRKDITWYDNRVTAELREQWAIAAEGPLFNKTLPPWRVGFSSSAQAGIRETHERLATEVFEALEHGCDLEDVARAAGWSPRYVIALGEKRRSPWTREYIAQIRDGKVKG